MTSQFNAMTPEQQMSKFMGGSQTGKPLDFSQYGQQPQYGQQGQYAGKKRHTRKLGRYGKSKKRRG
jgi:hypothetical protein